MPDQRHYCVQVPATSANLGPGYDVFGLALGVHLVVRSLPRDEQPERVVTVGDGADDLSTGDDNLVWRSVEEFCARTSVPVPDVALRASTRIPLQRGLGSSSSAIVAGIALARALTGVRMGDRELVRMATAIEGHPDNVAPALLGGLVACAVDDVGELVVRRVNPAPRLSPVVFVPMSRQSTAAARGIVPQTLSCREVVDQVGRSGHVLGALAGLWPVAVGAVGDRLHEPPRLEAMRGSGELVEVLRSRGVHAWLSGAGPTIAAVVGGDMHEQAGDGAALHTLADELGFELRTPAFDLAGTLVCPDDGCALAGAAGGEAGVDGNVCVQCPRRRV